MCECEVLCLVRLMCYGGSCCVMPITNRRNENKAPTRTFESERQLKLVINRVIAFSSRDNGIETQDRYVSTEERTQLTKLRRKMTENLSHRVTLLSLYRISGLKNIDCIGRKTTSNRSPISRWNEERVRGNFVNTINDRFMFIFGDIAYFGHRCHRSLLR